MNSFCRIMVPRDSIVDRKANGSLKFSFWNIRGFQSKILGKKFICKDFSDQIQDHDIIGLAETHIHTAVVDELAIPGYELVKYINCERNPKSHTAPGGLALFCKENVYKYIIPMKSNNRDIIWVKIKKDLTGLDRELFLGTLYFSPSGKKECAQKKYQALAEDISKFQPKGYIILQGDFNAHTNNCQDYIEIDENSEELDGESSPNSQPGNSEDKSKIDFRGEELIELCKSFNLNILNGRTSGDIFGKITSFHWNGKAVVDYFIASNELHPSFTSMRVGNYNPFLSDHCPLSCVIKANSKTVECTQDNLRERPIQFQIRETDKAKFIETLKREEISCKLNPSHWNNENIASKLVTEITDTLIDATKTARLKPKIVLKNCNAPWFDIECQTLKNSIKRKCRKLKHLVDNHTLNLEILNDNKILKKMVKTKRDGYKKGILEDMKVSKKDQNLFWKLLDKLQDKSNNVKNNISAQKWKTHFQSILQSKTPAMKYPSDSQEVGPLDYNIDLDEMLKAFYVLKCNKATGYDSLSNEMIKCLLDINPTILLKLFNCILKENPVIDKWRISILNTIYKSGNKADTSNYRGISIMSCLGKFFQLYTKFQANNLRTKE